VNLRLDKTTTTSGTVTNTTITVNVDANSSADADGGGGHRAWWSTSAAASFPVYFYLAHLVRPESLLPYCDSDSISSGSRSDEDEDNHGGTKRVGVADTRTQRRRHSTLYAHRSRALNAHRIPLKGPARRVCVHPWRDTLAPLSEYLRRTLFDELRCIHLRMTDRSDVYQTRVVYFTTRFVTSLLLHFIPMKQTP